MFDYLDNLRRKPTHVRMQITYATTSVLFFVILTVWWNSWTAESTAQTNLVITEKSPINVVVGTFAGMKDQTVSSWKDTVTSLEKLAATSTNIATVGASVDAEIPLDSEENIIQPLDEGGVNTEVALPIPEVSN